MFYMALKAIVSSLGVSTVYQETLTTEKEEKEIYMPPTAL